MKIKLTTSEAIGASAVGCQQMIEVVDKEWVGNDHGGKGKRPMRERWENSIQGIMAECACCKALGIFWGSGEGRFVGSNDSNKWKLQIKSTTWLSGHLIISERDVVDHANTPFVLVVGHYPEFEIKGWCYGMNARRPAWYREDGDPPSYWVPQECLMPMKDLKLELS